MDLTATLVSHSARAFSVTLECQKVWNDIQTSNKESVDKLASVEEDMKKIKAETEELRAQWIEDVAKFDAALAEIEALKREIYESRYKISSLTKKLQTIIKS